MRVCRDHVAIHHVFFFLILKKISGFFVLKNDFQTFQTLDHLTVRLIWQVIMSVFELLFCCFCCAFCCVFAVNIISWVWGKFPSCFVRFCVFSWQIIIANFLLHFFVAKLLMLICSFKLVLGYFF